MIEYPPKPTSFLPNEEDFDGEEWIAQPKYRGWRVVIPSSNIVYTRHRNVVPIEVSYKPEWEIGEYQLDGEIINPQRHTEYGVRRAILDGTWQLKIFDIFVQGKDYTLDERIRLLNTYFKIYPLVFYINTYNDMFYLRDHCKGHGFEGVVIKRRDSLYKISKHISIIDPDWVKLK